MGALFPETLAFIWLFPTCTRKDDTTYFSGCRAITVLDNGTVPHKHQLLEIVCVQNCPVSTSRSSRHLHRDRVSSKKSTDDYH